MYCNNYELNNDSVFEYFLITNSISGVAKVGPGPPKCCLCPATKIEKDQDTLIEQSNILIKQSVGQVVPANLLSLAMTLHIATCLLS